MGNNIRMLKVKVKIWLHSDDEIVIGEGVRRLLQAIDQTGSINQASEKLRMSYRRAWEKIHLAEDRLGKSLVITQAGGAHGGGSILTQTAKDFLRAFDELENDVANYAAERFNELFARLK